MSLHIRFELVRPRHRRETRKPRAASAHWQGRAVTGKTKMHIMNVNEHVSPDDVTPFLMRAETVLKAMGASAPESDEILREARRFLEAHLRASPPAPNTNGRGAARAALERLRARHSRRAVTS